MWLSDTELAEQRRIVGPMSFRRFVSILSLATAIGLTGCASGDRSASLPPEFVGGDAMPDMMTEEAMPADMAVESAVVERSQIITGDVYLTVESPSETADAVAAIVESAGGRVDSRSEYTDPEGQNPSAYLWVRIPVDSLEATLSEIEALGIVESKSLNNTDVTLQVVDLDARIAVLTESISRLEALLVEATSTAEIVEIETALSERQAELDSLTSQRNYLADQVSYASIGVDLRTPEVAPERDPGTFLDGIVSGWNAMLSFFAGSVVFFGFILPWLGLAVAVVIAVAIIVIIRRKTRKY